MKTFNITEAEQKQLDYIEQGINNLRTAEQNIAIELQDRDRRIARREKLKDHIRSKLSTEAKTVWINSEMKRMTEDELTEEIIEAETQFLICNED